MAYRAFETKSESSVGKVWSIINGFTYRNVLEEKSGEPTNLVRRSLFGFGKLPGDGYAYPGGAAPRPGEKKKELTPDEKSTISLNDYSKNFTKILETYENNKDSRNIGWGVFAVGMIFLLALWFTGNLFEWVGKGFMLNLLMCLFLFVGLGKAMSSRPNKIPVANSADKFLTTIYALVEKPRDQNGFAINIPVVMEAVFGNRDNNKSLQVLLQNAPETQMVLASRLKQYCREIISGGDHAAINAALLTDLNAHVASIKKAEAERLAAEKAERARLAALKEQEEADKKAAQSKRSAAMKDTGKKKEA